MSLSSLYLLHAPFILIMMCFAVMLIQLAKEDKALREEMKRKGVK